MSRTKICISLLSKILEEDLRKSHIDMLMRIINIVNFLKENEPMEMTAKDMKTFDSAKVCHICEKPFNKKETSTEIIVMKLDSF